MHITAIISTPILESSKVTAPKTHIIFWWKWWLQIIGMTDIVTNIWWNINMIIMLSWNKATLWYDKAEQSNVQLDVTNLLPCQSCVRWLTWLFCCWLTLWSQIQRRMLKHLSMWFWAEHGKHSKLDKNLQFVAQLQAGKPSHCFQIDIHVFNNHNIIWLQRWHFNTSIYSKTNTRTKWHY